MEPVEPCKKCGKVHTTKSGVRACNAHKRNHEPCTNAPMHGGFLCRMHGGATKPRRDAAALRVENQRARTMLQRLGNPEPLEHPVYELLKLGAEMRAYVDFFRERIAELDQLYTTDDFGTEHERALVLLYERGTERLMHMLADLARLDLQTRSLALQKEAATDMMRAIVTAMARMGLAERTRELRSTLSTVLREMHGSQVVPAPVLPSGEEPTD